MPIPIQPALRPVICQPGLRIARCGSPAGAPGAVSVQLRRGHRALLEGEGHFVGRRGLEPGWVGGGEHRGQLVLTPAQEGDRSDGEAAEHRDRSAKRGGAVRELNGPGRVSRAHPRGGDCNPTQSKG
jgi:hypothetical protein